MKKLVFVLAVVCAMMVSACGSRTAKTETTEAVVECCDSTVVDSTSVVVSAADSLAVEEAPATE